MSNDYGHIHAATTAAAEEAGAPGIEVDVTPAMIEAAMYVLFDLVQDFAPPERRVALLYTAMELVRRSKCDPSAVVDSLLSREFR